MIGTRIKLTLFVGVALGSTALPSLVQAADKEKTDQIDEIIVTARRSEERLQDVPISISVYSQEQLAKRNIVTSSDLATYTPSLSVNQRFGPEKAALQIRGFNQDNGTAPTVGAYFADVVSPRAFGSVQAGGFPPIGSYMDLQNVQVLKGPQGTLFGRNTTGGAVLLVPTKPTDQLEGWVEGSGGSYNLQRGQGVLNLPIADTLKVRVSLDRNHREGYNKNQSGIGPKDFNDVNYFYGRISIVADITPNLENYTIAHYSDSHSNGYASRIVICNPNLRPGGNPSLIVAGALFTATPACNQVDRQNARGDGPLDVDVGVPRLGLQLKQWQVINTTTWQLNDSITVKNIASYGEYKEKNHYSLDSDNFKSDFGVRNGVVPYPVGIPFTYVNNAPQPSGYNTAEQGITEELQIRGRTGALTWQAGGYLENGDPIGFNKGFSPILFSCTDPQNLACSPTFNGVSSISAPSSTYFYRNRGLYAQATYDFTSQLSVTGGIRNTWDRAGAHNESTRIALNPDGSHVFTCNDVVHRNAGKNAAGALIPLVVTDPSQCSYNPPDAASREPTGLIDVDYKLTPDALLYAKYARGYRSGGINLAGVGLEGWGPEKVDAYELGSKFSFHGAMSGFINTAVFYNDFRGMQVAATGVSNVAGFSGGSVIANAGKSRIGGFEIDASVTPLRGLKFDLGYTYLDSKLEQIAPITVPLGAPYSAIVSTAKVGGPLAQTPKNRYTLTGTYTLPLDASLGEISIGATYVHTDSQILAQTTLGGIATPTYADIAAAGGLAPVLANYLSGQPSFVNQPATDLLNINLNWDKVVGTQFDAAFYMTNVTNQIYPVANTTAWQAGGFEALTYGMPRMWGLSVRYSFGG